MRLGCCVEISVYMIHWVFIPQVFHIKDNPFYLFVEMSETLLGVSSRRYLLHRPFPTSSCHLCLCRLQVAPRTPLLSRSPLLLCIPFPPIVPTEVE